ncbi:glyoxalase [Actinacidiphila glaucinigra]|uniref:glyoxalase n=1 Tax=Actinacidiphila glaucinigra TaxID=235986 RepID=UPI0033C1BE3A
MLIKDGEMDCSLEAVIVPVADVDRSSALYTERAGFALDVDHAPADGFRVVQLAPPGSACSVQIGVGLTDAVPGSLRNLHMVVDDVERARRDLAERGVAVGEVRHKWPVGEWRGVSGPGWTRSTATTPASSASPTRTAAPGWCRSEVSAERHEPRGAGGVPAEARARPQDATGPAVTRGSFSAYVRFEQFG